MCVELIGLNKWRLHHNIAASVDVVLRHVSVLFSFFLFRLFPLYSNGSWGSWERWLTARSANSCPTTAEWSSRTSRIPTSKMPPSSSSFRLLTVMSEIKVIRHIYLCLRSNPPPGAQFGHSEGTLHAVFSGRDGRQEENNQVQAFSRNTPTHRACLSHIADTELGSPLAVAASLLTGPSSAFSLVEARLKAGHRPRASSRSSCLHRECRVRTECSPPVPPPSQQGNRQPCAPSRRS